MRYPYDIAVIIGRFQPIHKGHIPLFKKAEEVAAITMCIVGSVDKPSTPLNPFSFKEREQLIIDALKEERLDNAIHIEGVRDSFYCERDWIRSVKEKLDPIITYVKGSKFGKHRHDIWDIRDWLRERNIKQKSYDVYLQLHGHETLESRQILRLRELEKEVQTVNICVIGYEKDASTYYLNNFADWDRVDVPGHNGEFKHDRPMDASHVRELWLTNRLYTLRSIVHENTYEFMRDYPENEYLDLVEEYEYVKQYELETQVGPFPVQFLTTDAVVIHGDEVLLIRRGEAPGKGLWALPGGFKGQYETFFDSCIRELREETRISVPEKVLRGSVKDERVFDYPKRSSRGTTVSMAYLFVLDAAHPRPRVKGGDDAVQAWWFSLSEIDRMRDQLFEDHPDIIDYMTARI